MHLRKKIPRYKKISPSVSLIQSKGLEFRTINLYHFYLYLDKKLFIFRIHVGRGLIIINKIP